MIDRYREISDRYETDRGGQNSVRLEGAQLTKLLA